MLKVSGPFREPGQARSVALPPRSGAFSAHFATFTGLFRPSILPGTPVEKLFSFGSLHINMERGPIMGWTNGFRAKTWILALATGWMVSVLSPKEASACTCLQPTVEASYNHSTDVALVRVNASLRWGSTRYYLGTVQKPFKGCSEDGDPVIIRTASSSAACGTTFSVGESYLINGSDEGSLLGVSVLGTGLCSYNLEASDLTQPDLDFLFGRNVCCGSDCNCADGSQPVNCFADPCQVAGECPDGTCVANYCGGCNAEFYDEQGYAVCEDVAAECASDADCSSDQWCRQTDPGAAEGAETYACVPLVGEGEACEGFTLPWLFERCAEGLMCDTPDDIADAPGICRPACSDDADCGAEEYCAADGVCMADGEADGCYSDADCAAGTRCNAAEVCLPPPGCTPGNACPTVCYGECVPVETAECASDDDCIATGCSGQVCAAESVITTCEYRPEYACYDDPYTSCGCHEGSCGWAPTPELEACLAEAGDGALVTQ